MDETMVDEVENLRATLQDLIARAERDLGSDHEFCSALRSADDNLKDAVETGCEPTESTEE